MIRFIKMSISVILIASLMVGIPIVSKVAEKKVEAATYNLIWSDEFDGDSLNLNDWNIEVNGEGGGNQERQYYTDRPENIEVSDGTLKIHALKENYIGKQYTSGRINTKDKKSFKYGKIEARMKLPRFSGSWPAFWMLGANYKSVGWPRCGEIDIMEAINDNDNIYANLHWSNGNIQDDTSGAAYAINDRTAWHTYGLIWNENYVKFYVDDKIFQSYLITSEDDMEEFRKEQFIILNLAIGGKWPGYNIDKNAFPDKSTMEVDYVRAYEKVDETTTYNGPTKAITEDAVQEHQGEWMGYFDTDKVKTAGTITQLGTASDGFVADIPSIGYSEKTSFWFVQAMLNNLHIYNGATYRYNCTITADQDKIVYVMVVDSDDLVLGGEYVELKAGEPYSFSKSVKIPNDFDSELSLKFGFGKSSRDALSNYSPINVRVENISFVTSTFIPDPTTTVTTTTKEQTTKNQKKNTVVKVEKAKIKKVYKKKKTAKKVKLVLNNIPNVDKYQVAVYKKKKNANKNSKSLITKLFNKTKITIKTKKIKNKKKLYIRARGVRTENKVSRYGEWSDIKKVKIKK